MMSRITIIALATALALGYMVLSSWEYADDVHAERRYIEAVCAGMWPDYQRLEPECGEGRRSDG